MTSTDDIRAQIDLDEINYPALARELGPEALPALEEIARDPNVTLASKAVYLASQIGGDQAMPILEQATASPAPALRVAAAAATRNLEQSRAEPALDPLLRDVDPGVRKVALRSAVVVDSPALRQRVAAMADKDEDEAIRAAARDALPGAGS
jgi:HEAT repeat protein